MANETKIYVGEEGAKELYRHIKGLIPTVDDGDTLLEDSHNPVSSRVVYNALRNFGGFEPAEPTGEDHHPDVSEPSTKTIYLVELPDSPDPDHYMEWIWSQPEGAEGEWKCIGDVSKLTVDSWKQWSSEHGSTANGDNAVFIGPNNTIDRDDTYVLGDSNTVEATDQTDYSDTDVVVIGTDNTATNAANAYQLGRENTVTGNNLANKLYYPHSVAVNIGRNNDIVGEGVNIGKDNDATTFGINIGQNNCSSNASCSVGQHVMSDNASLSIGNADPTSSNATVGNVPTLLVNGSYEHVQKFRLKKQYHLCEYATTYKDPVDNKYKWVAIQSIRLSIYPNYELDQYLVSWGSGQQSGTITGYYDDEGVFHESSDTSHNIHTYAKITNVGNPSGSERVPLNPPFYASYVNQEQTKNYITYVMRAGITLPAYGTILNRAEYDAIIAGSVTPVMPGSVSNLFIDLDDLTADGYKLSGLIGLQFPLSYEVYGYKNNGVLIPYNELNKDETHDFGWYEVDRSDIQGKTLPVKQVNPHAELITSDDRSATFGTGSLYASGRSITISTNTISAYQMRYKDTYETNMYHTNSGTCYTINQDTGNWTTKSVTISCFTKKSGDSFTSKVAPYCASADGSSIVISNEYGTAYGSSVAIGNYANANGFAYAIGRSSTANNDAFAFGNAAFGYEHSMALGFENSYATKSSLSFGISGVSAYERSVAIGFDGVTSQKYSLAIACGGYASEKSMIFGFNNNASGDAIAIGRNNSIYQEATGLGANNLMYYQNIAIGYSNNMQNTSDTSVHATLIGTSNNTGTGGYNIGIGEYNTASHEGIAIGRNNKAYGWSIAMGVNNRSSYVAGGHATLIGYENISEYDKERISFTDDTVSSTYDIPMYTGYQYSLSEQLFLADELGTSGSINSIQLYCDSYPATRNIEVYLLNTTKSSFTSYSDWVTTSSSPVFSGNVTFYTGWNYINFTSTFNYGAGKNLLLIIVDKTGSYASPTMYMKGYTRPDYAQLALCTYRSTPISPSSITGESYVYMYTRSVVRFTIDNRTVGVPDIIPKNGYVYTNSVLMGNLNTARHYNSFLFGVGNYSYEALPLGSNSSDDGFVFAMGRENVVGRNYDFAYGYKSKASGGENIAFQHSTAIGFRNLAMFDSFAIGTANVALMESDFSYDNVSGRDTNTLFTHNALLCSRMTSDTPISNTYGVHHNVLMMTNAKIYGTKGVEGNFIFGGRIDYDYYGTPSYPINITATSGITGNIIFGNKTSGIIVDAADGLRNNLIVCPEQMIVDSDNVLACNVLLNSNLNITKSWCIEHNLMYTANISGKFGNLRSNIVLGNSSIISSNDSQANCILKNVLLNDAKLTHTTALSAWSGTMQPTSENILFSSWGEDILNCFSFSDVQPGASREYALLTNCLRVFNVGDNIISRTMESQVFGGANTINNARKIFVVGEKNNLASSSNNSLGSQTGVISGTVIFGGENNVYVGSTTTTDRVFINGHCNNTYNTCYDERIFGNANNIGIGSTPTIYEISTMDAYEAAVASTTPTIIRTTKEFPIPGLDSYKTAGATFYSGWNCLYKDGLVYTTWTSQSSSTRISGTNFITAYVNNTLVDGRYYYLTSNGTVPSGVTISMGAMTETYSDSIIYQAGNGKVATASSTYYNTRHFIAGDKNNIYCGIHDATIFGTDNTIARSLGNYSNIFIQGNNNSVNEGSGSVVMGSGTIATGHMSVAIGTQLKSSKWQTVIGKYNMYIEGPERLVDGEHESDKALFIIGNGYSENDGKQWQTESLIHRSNAMVVYADGHLKVAGALEGSSLSVSGAINGGSLKVTGMVDAQFILTNNGIYSNGPVNASNIPYAPSDDGTYTLQCVVSNGEATYSWVPVGFTTVS